MTNYQEDDIPPTSDPPLYLDHLTENLGSTTHIHMYVNIMILKFAMSLLAYRLDLTCFNEMQLLQLLRQVNKGLMSTL